MLQLIYALVFDGKNVPYFMVKARHADTVNRAREYNEALRQIEKMINTLS